MGTWGSGIFQSDNAAEFFDKYRDLLTREIVYQMSPQQLKILNRSFAGCLFAAMDLLSALVEHYDLNFLVEEPIVQIWRDTFLATWDKSISDATEQERLIITALFYRLMAVEDVYDDTLYTRQPTLAPESLAEIPATFEALTKSKDRGWSYGILLIEKVIDSLRKELIYWFSLEQRKQLHYEHGDELIPAADLLAFICDYYHRSPELSARKIRHWQKVLLRFWDKAVATPEGMGKPDYEVGRRKVFVETFEKLEAVARKYPPFLGDDE